MIYTFTPEERAAIHLRYQEFIRTVALIAEIHGIKDWALSPDQSGFTAVNQEQK